MDAEMERDPYALLDSWLARAAGADADYAPSMVLATAGEGGRPSARVVFYRGRSGEALRFFTNYESRKGRELEQNPHAALAFHWAGLRRQVRVEGTVARLGAEESDDYFRKRPRESQLGAWASPQSQVVASRAELDARYAEAERRFAAGPVARPPHWGGYGLYPESFEFWIGRERRLHDRYRFLRAGDAWRKERLGP
jgi:pyridoxamine 5'-phosphate oxidase